MHDGGAAMKIIQELSEHIEEEIHDAECYAKMAIHYHETEPEAAELFFTLSKEEMQHMAKLHHEAADLITKYRKEHGEPPESMMAVYNYLHDKSMEHAAQVRQLQGMYNA